MTIEHAITAAPDRGAPVTMSKLSVPATPLRIVLRPRLLQRLDTACTGALTILSAPAGFGKTTLLAMWFAQKIQADGRVKAPNHAAIDQAQPTAIAWLSLDAADSDPARFWRYVFVALRRVLPDLPADLATPLRATPPNIERVVAELTATLAARAANVVLVLDDYHTISEPAVHHSLAALLERGPPGLHVVIAGQSDPPLPPALLGARDQPGAIHADDLRFNQAEIGLFLRQTIGLNISAETSAALAAATQGWPAATQLAALWLRAKPEAANPAVFNQAERYLLAFLAEKVIAHQSAEIQHFLLESAILDRMCPALCDYLSADTPAVAMRPAQELLFEIERNNLFLTSLEADGRWYMYHPIFRDFLQQELPRRQGPHAAVRLHRRAAAWFAAASADAPALLEEALHHAFAGHDNDVAADLILAHFDQLGAQGRIDQLIDWLNTLPEAILSARPALGLRYTWVLFLHGRREEAIRRLTVVAADPALHADCDPLTAALPYAFAPRSPPVTTMKQACATMPNRLRHCCPPAKQSGRQWSRLPRAWPNSSVVKHAAPQQCCTMPPIYPIALQTAIV